MVVIAAMLKHKEGMNVTGNLSVVVFKTYSEWVAWCHDQIFFLTVQGETTQVFWIDQHLSGHMGYDK